jgi:hypothetical protein
MEGGRMRMPGRSRWLPWLALPVVAGVSLTAVVVSSASTSSGCGNVDAPILESQQFTPYEARLSHLPEFPLNPTGGPPMPVPSEIRVPSIDGLPLRWATVSSNGAVYQYFLGSDMDPDMTVARFVAARGIQLDRDPVENAGESFADYLVSTLGERAVEVEIGDYTGALTWADPLIDGSRPHHLYWSDGAFNYVLIGDRSPETLVTLGRQLVCSGPLAPGR